MPFISRLKKLGLLPIPGLSTTLTVYLIPLEHSPETNLVYTSSSPIPSDVAPPADLRFDHPEGQTSAGDVLIWASRVHKKACYVHVCWVFDGVRWNKPDSASEIMTDHPVHSDYQLVVLSGPYVKWELKPDPDREPSLTVPDPPPLRPGARGSINTIVLPQASNPPQRPRSSDLASDTPDGSALLGSSSRFSTPLSDVPESTKLANSNSASAPGPSSVSAPARSQKTRAASHRSTTTPPVPGAPPTPDSSRALPRRHKRHRGDEDAFVPSSRRASSSIPPAKRRRLNGEPRASRTPERRVVNGSGKIGTIKIKAGPGSVVKRTRVLRALSPGLLEQLFNQGATRKEAEEDDPDAEGESDSDMCAQGHPGAIGAGEAENEGEDGDLWSQLWTLQREKDALAANVRRMARQYPDVRVCDTATQTDDSCIELEQVDTMHVDAFYMRNHTDSPFKGIDTIELPPASHKSPLSSPAPHTHTAIQTDSTTTPYPADFASPRGTDKTLAEFDDARADLAAARVEACAAREALVRSCTRPPLVHAQTQTVPSPPSPHRVSVQLQSAGTQTSAPATIPPADFEARLSAARVEAAAAKRAANDIATARAADVRHFQGQHAQLAARNAHLEGRNSQLEGQLAADPLRRPSESETQAARRAASFEVSLRVAQEALQRQRAQAQATEAMQARTIAQLARELKEKEVEVRKLTKGDGVDKGVGADKDAWEEEKEQERMEVERWREVEREVGVLREGVSARDEALKKEREFVARAKREIERIKEATKDDRTMIADQHEELTRTRAELAEKAQANAAQLQAHETRVAQLQREKEACDTALAALTRTRIDLQTQLEADATKHAAALAAESRARAGLASQLRDRTKEHVAEAQRHQAKLTTLTNRLKESNTLVANLQQEHRLYTVSRNFLESELRAAHVAHEEHDKQCRATQQSHEARMKATTEAHTATLAALTQQLDRERAENAEQHSKDVASAEQVRAELEKERERFGLECKERADLQQQLEGVCEELEGAKAERKELETKLASATARVDEEREVVQREVVALRGEYKKVEEALRAGLEREKGRAAEAQKVSAAELGAARDKFSTLEAAFAVATQERTKAEKLLAAERHTSSENKLNLDKIRADLEKANQEVKSIQGELSTCKAAFTESEQRQKDAHDATCKELEDSRAECVHLEEHITNFGNIRTKYSKSIHAHDATRQELKASRAECARLAKEIAEFGEVGAKYSKDLHELSRKWREALASKSHAEQELSSCKAAIAESEERQKSTQEASSRELEESRAECTRLTDELTVVRIATGDIEALKADCARLTDELAAMRTTSGEISALQAKCARLTEELAAKTTDTNELAVLQAKIARLQEELTAASTSTDDLEASRGECARLRNELAAERSSSSLSPDGLRARLAAAEAALEREKAALATAQEESSNYWADLGSQLLRSLHEVQDQLKVEQVARQRLQGELAAERVRGKSLGPGGFGPLQNSV